MALLELQNRMNLAVHRGAAPEESDLLLNEKNKLWQPSRTSTGQLPRQNDFCCSWFRDKSRRYKLCSSRNLKNQAIPANWLLLATESKPS
jgi:hypothetical protein